MREISLGFVNIQVYGLCLAVGVALALWWSFFRCRGMKENTVTRFALIVLPLAFLLGRLAQCAVSQGWHLMRVDYFFDFSRGGYLLYGAMGGVVLAAWITAKTTGQSAGRLLDALSAPGMMLIMVCRFSEGLIGEGYGRNIEDWFDPWGEFTFFPIEDPEPLLRFPFGIPDYYGDYHFSIFLLEGVAALIFLLMLWKKKTEVAGGVFLLGLILYAGAQTTLESMRADSLPKWGFVRVNQLLSALVLAMILSICTARQVREGKSVPWGAWAGLTGCAGIILAMEFALEKKIHFLKWMRMDLCYLVMTLASLGLILVCTSVCKKSYRFVTANSPGSI